LYKRILVALDGSEGSSKALEHAISIASVFNSELVLLTVVPRVIVPIFLEEGLGGTPYFTGKNMMETEEGIREAYQIVLSNASSKVKKEKPDLKVEAIMKEGRPSASIVDLAEHDDVDLIVMSSRGIGGYTGWILGSTSRRVVDSCTKPVLIVK
jgi:nucleotide-binding universal stress UspA family protein